LKKYEPGFVDRLGAAAKAKRDLLEKARANAPANDPKFAARQEARRVAGVARAARVSERNAAKLAEKARMVAEKDAAAMALAAEQEARKAEAAAQPARDLALAVERKAARDARYAARKARQK
jgi:hypothetical protein